VLAAVGPLTNVGAALRREPRLAGRLRALVIMGGRLGEGSERGEHNVNQDRLASQAVLEAGAALRVGTYEVTRRAVLGWDAVEKLRQSGDAACAGAAAQLALYLTRLNRPATSMYDPLSLTLAYTDRYLTMRPVRLAATYGDRLTRWEAVDGAPNAEVSVDVDAPAYQQHLLETIIPG
jgi:inosine-uridine nucleoside N-ribohydrolase